MSAVRVGIIGGTGLGALIGELPGKETVTPQTPFGAPSSPITLTELDGVPVALLQRHGVGHTLNPSRVPYRANLFALKSVGVTHVLATGAVGSLREEIAPGELVLVDQLIDHTSRRERTFFDDLAVHVEFADPLCPTLRRVLGEVASPSGGKLHPRGTYVCMEGPQFSTRAESALHRSMGADVVGMTAMPEAKLAREAELCYALIALPTDYDCWRPHPPGHDRQSLLAEILGNVKKASAAGLELIRRALPAVAKAPSCDCQTALSLAVFTDPARVPAETKQRLLPLLARHLGK